MMSGTVLSMPWLWDYAIDSAKFDEILSGRLSLGGLDRDWAAVRLIEYAPYDEIIRRIGFSALVRDWSRWRARVRAPSRRRGLDFVVEWIPRHHKELLL